MRRNFSSNTSNHMNSLLRFITNNLILMFKKEFLKDEPNLQILINKTKYTDHQMNGKSYYLFIKEHVTYRRMS